MVVQRKSNFKPKKSVTIASIDFKFNDTDGYYIESSYNKRLALRVPVLVDTLQDITEYGVKHLKTCFIDAAKEPQEETK